MKRRKPNKTTGSPEERAAQRAAKRAANQKAYAAARAQVGTKFSPGKVNPKRKRPKMKGPQNGQVSRRARGDRDDEDVANEVIELICCGMPRVKALKAVKLSQTQWHGWVNQNRFNLAERYPRAKAMQAESWEDDILGEAEKAKHNNFNGHKLRIETKKWLMGKHNSRYADKATTVLEGGKNPVRTINSAMTEKEAMEAWQATMANDGLAPPPVPGEE